MTWSPGVTWKDGGSWDDMKRLCILGLCRCRVFTFLKVSSVMGENACELSLQTNSPIVEGIAMYAVSVSCYL